MTRSPNQRALDVKNHNGIVRYCRVQLASVSACMIVVVLFIKYSFLTPQKKFSQEIIKND